MVRFQVQMNLKLNHLNSRGIVNPFKLHWQKTHRFFLFSILSNIFVILSNLLHVIRKNRFEPQQHYAQRANKNRLDCAAEHPYVTCQPHPKAKQWGRTEKWLSQAQYPIWQRCFLWIDACGVGM
jgi:hypothetical protein